MNFYEKVAEIVSRDARYKPDAYEFVMQALLFTQKKNKRPGHLKGRELLEGIREYGLDQYGPMTVTVFEHWGMRTTDDIGAIVFAMVESGLLSKTEQDSRDDFRNVYNFREAFDAFRKTPAKRRRDKAPTKKTI